MKMKRLCYGSSVVIGARGEVWGWGTRPSWLRTEQSGAYPSWFWEATGHTLPTKDDVEKLNEIQKWPQVNNVYRYPAQETKKSSQETLRPQIIPRNSFSNTKTSVL